VVPPVGARPARSVLGAVVERGTAARLHGAFVDSTGAPIWVGGKTGTGDNRFDTFGRGRRLISSRAVSRTAAFAFCLGDRYYGVVTASVLGPEADQYTFTSVLPVEVLRRLAPSIEKRLHLVGGSAPAGAAVAAVQEGAAESDDVMTDSTAVPASLAAPANVGAAPAPDAAPAAPADVKSGAPAKTGEADDARKGHDDAIKNRDAERAKKRREIERRRQWDWESPSRAPTGGRL
jgi:hypothetical protein